MWNHVAYAAEMEARELPPVLGVGSFNHKSFARQFAIPVPARNEVPDPLVYREGDRILLPPRGFFLWQTKEEVGTPEFDPRLICFLDGKSTRARTGLLVHVTAQRFTPDGGER